MEREDPDEVRTDARSLVRTEVIVAYYMAALGEPERHSRGSLLAGCEGKMADGTTDKVPKVQVLSCS